MQRTDQLEVELQRDIESARMFRLGIWSGEAETHVCSLLQITDKVGHSGRQDRAQPRHGLGRDRGQIHAETVPGLRVPPGDGGWETFPGHGSRYRLSQQTGCWSSRQGWLSELKTFVSHLSPPLQVCLMSRDEQNVLVVSYAELKNCLEQSYGEVLSSATAKPKLHLGLS